MPLNRRQFLGTAAGAALALRAGRAANRFSIDSPPRFIVAALAPLNAKKSIDEGLTRDYLEYLRAGGVDGVLVNGTTGEFASFSQAERKKNLEVFLKYKGALSVMCQVGTPNLAETTDLLAHAASVGADSALALPPYYFNQPPDEGLAEYFRLVLKSAKIPVLLYNIPQVSEVEITLELVRMLENEPNLYGIKDSWGKIERTSAYIEQFRRMKVFTGASNMIAHVLKIGGGGALTGNGNVFPKETAAILAAHRAGKDLESPQAALNDRNDLLKGMPGVPAMKFTLGELGIGRMSVRTPMVDLTVDQKNTLRERLKQAGMLS